MGSIFYGISVDELLACGIVAFALYALNLAEELADKVAHLLVVVDLDIGFAAFLHELHHFVFLAVPKNPFGDELTVAHMGFFHVLAEFDAVELGSRGRLA